jgi:hypothetical protein
MLNGAGSGTRRIDAGELGDPRLHEPPVADELQHVRLDQARATAVGGGAMAVQLVHAQLASDRTAMCRRSKHGVGEARSRAGAPRP